MEKISVRNAIRDAMAEEMRADKNVFLIGEEVADYEGAYKVSQGLLKEFGASRIIDTPITEAGFTGLAVGAAMRGLKPIVEFMTWNFAMQAIDHIVNSAAKTHYMSGGNISLPIVFRGPNGSASRVAAQHSQDYSSWYSHIPGLKVVAPYDAYDAKQLLKASIKDPNPIIFLENELMYNEVFSYPEGKQELSLGKADIVREGKDITIVSFSRGMMLALKAAEVLQKKDISAEIINLRTLKPLDMDKILGSVKKTNRLLCIEEGWSYSGIGSEIIASVTKSGFDYLDSPPERITAADVPLPYADNLEREALPDLEKVIEVCSKLCYLD